MSSIREGMMRAARFHSGGEIRIDEVPIPQCPHGGILVQSLASGLCSGELMGWYMERKAASGPHVLGHEVCGVVVESQDDRFPVGIQVSPHHHAPCFECEVCRKGQFVHCETWRTTKLDPGGMSEYFGVSRELLGDCRVTDGLDHVTATLVEPLACVAKQLRRLGYQEGEKSAVIGLGVMGLLHTLMMPGSVAFERNQGRIDWSVNSGVNARLPDTSEKFDVIVVCPGSEEAFEFALSIANPGARIGLFAPLPPGKLGFDFERAYMQDLILVNSYSCGPNDTEVALNWLKSGRIRGEHVVSHRISLSNLPEAYEQMKRGDILKPVVMFG
ncbi:hypothetical protein CCB80_13980 [Armatimonadetes bacterium Uphvl-Ar1]|nr:hypothetical protein CCB80_13980 [Armatimonadetes bacterium Uphvl-Ar1]